MFPGFFSYAGTEIINTARTASYANDCGVGWLQDCYDCGDLAEVLGDKPYTVPLVDQPPWFDPDDIDTWNFAGFYPLSITGLNDSTRQAEVTESIDHGGSVGRVRFGTRTIQFTGLLVASDDCAIEKGMAWLRAALFNPCPDIAEGCSGGDLCFYSCCPEVCEDSPGYDPEDPTTCGFEYERTFRQVTCTEGPTVLEVLNVSTGAAWEVEFTLVAATPWIYGPTRPVLEGGTVPGGSIFQHPNTTVQNLVIPDDPGGCAPEELDWLQDPDCPVVPSPPSAPIPEACLERPDEWTRFALHVPAEFVPAWTEAVPTVAIHTADKAVRQVRVRFYSNPLGLDDVADIDLCAFCGEFFIAYIPADSIMTVDGTTSTAIVTVPGDTRLNAAHLLSSAEGGPFSWPLLTCGHAYIMTVDVTPLNVGDITVDLDMTARGGSAG